MYSIEHYEHWFNQIHKLINKNLLGNVDIQHKPLGEGFDQEYIEGFRNMSESPDFMLIYGKKRDLCALEAVNIVKDGGLGNNRQYKSLHTKQFTSSRVCKPLDWIPI